MTRASRRTLAIFYVVLAVIVLPCVAVTVRDGRTGWFVYNVVLFAWLVHIEQMNDRCWWIGIYVGDDKRLSGNFWCDCGRMGFSPQDDDIEWGEDRTRVCRRPSDGE